MGINKNIKGVSDCLQRFEEHSKTALSFSSPNADLQKQMAAFNSFRKAAEAFVKIYIYNRYGDSHGDDIISGRKDFLCNDRETDKTDNPKGLLLNELLNIQRDLRNYRYNGYWDNSQYKNYYSRIVDIQKYGGGNTYSHDNPADNHLQGDLTLLRTQLHHLAIGLYEKDLGEDLPECFQNLDQPQDSQAYDTVVTSPQWNEFIEYVGKFDGLRRYILVTPASYENCTEQSLRQLLKIHAKLSLVIDFNPDTDTKDGLLHSLGDSFSEKHTVPVLITQLDDKPIIKERSQKTVNWLFANGKSTIPDTTTDKYKDWRDKKYHKLIGKIFEEMSNSSRKPICVVFIETEIDYMAEIMRIIDDNDAIKNESVRIAYCSCDADNRLSINKNLYKGMEGTAFDLSFHDILAGMSTFASEPEEGPKYVPAITSSLEKHMINISDLWNRMYDSYIEIVHQNIALSANPPTTDGQPSIPSFFKGNIISWQELSRDIDVRRHDYDSFKRKVESLFHKKTGTSVVFRLNHAPGAGGTTLARKLAYELRLDYPTVVISRITEQTQEQLSTLIGKTNSPLLAIVEQADVRLNDIQTLADRLNKNKQIVVFVYVRRIIKVSKKDSGGELSFKLSDSITDLDEANRFIEKLKQYNTDEQKLKAFISNGFCNEVIDFTLALSYGIYERAKLKDYLKMYIYGSDEDKWNGLTDATWKFLAFVALVYHYTQRKTSIFLFDNMHVTEKLNNGLESDFLQKILTQEYENEDPTGYWRPRYDLFAELVLQLILGNNTQESNWKLNLPEYARAFINTIHENSPVLDDDTKNLLVNLFLDRGNDEYMTDIEYISTIQNDRFSRLLEDLGGNTEEQKNILSLLAHRFPGEPHFWAHLGRFVFEKAQSIEDFNEALGYINRAFEEGGDKDTNILHMAGQCQRRKIEFLYQNSKQKGASFDLETIIALTESSQQYFEESRKLDKENIYAYVSEIQLILRVLEIGKELAGLSGYYDFLFNPSNQWFLELYELLFELSEDANHILMQQEKYGLTKKVMVSRTKMTEADLKRIKLLGNYSGALERLNGLIEKSPMEHRPSLRRMYVHTLLLSKVQGDNNRTTEAWRLLKGGELEKVNKLLSTNIQQNSNDAYSLRKWLDFVRYSNVQMNEEEIISRMKSMHEHSEEGSINKGFFAYYLMILLCIRMIRQGEQLRPGAKDEIKAMRKDSKESAVYEKHPFEWLKSLDSGIKGIVTDKSKRDSNEPLIEISGSITNIRNPKQGTIRLDSCGVDAFFVPLGNFLHDRDISRKVLFNIGFRRDGLEAYNVRRADEPRQDDAPNANDEPSVIEEIDQTEDTVPKGQMEEPVNSDSGNKNHIPPRKIQLSGNTTRINRLKEGQEFDGTIVRKNGKYRVKSEYYPHALQIEYSDSVDNLTEKALVTFTARNKADKNLWVACQVKLKPEE